MKNIPKANFLTDEREFFEAIFSGESHVIRYLLTRNKSLANAISSTSKNPALHLAVNRGNAEIVQLLLDNGADINLKAHDELPILHRAAIYRRSELIEQLVRAKADINSKDSYHSPILFHAAAKGYHDMVSLLLKLKAEINISDNLGVTALHCAIINGNIKVVEFLLNAKANIEKPTVEGKMALHAAASEGPDQIVSLILQAKANIDVQDHNGNTALHIAAAHMRTENVKLLINAKANPSICDKAGYIAAYYIHKWSPELAQLLNPKSDKIQEDVSKIEPNPTLLEVVPKIDTQITAQHSPQTAMQTDNVVENVVRFEVQNQQGLRSPAELAPEERCLRTKDAENQNIHEVAHENLSLDATTQFSSRQDFCRRSIEVSNNQVQNSAAILENNPQVNDSSNTVTSSGDVDVIGTDAAVSQGCFIL